jgi:general secretion pathway protein H
VSGCADASRGDHGFTLIEILIVIVLVGLVMAASVRGMRAVAKSDLRGSATKMAGAIRYLFDRASTTGRIHRLVIDFEEGRYWAEVSEDRFLLPRERETEESRRAAAERLAAEEEERKEKDEATAREFSTGSFDVSRYQPEEFRPKRATFSTFREIAVKPVTIPSTVKLASLFSPRLAEPVSSGQGYIYFFPLGLTEAAFVHLSDPGGSSFSTRVVHPLTGRVRIDNAYVEPPIAEQFDDAGERIDPGVEK